MEKGYSLSSPEIGRYVESVFRPEDPVLSEIRARARNEGLPEIHVGRMDGLHLEVLARASGGHRIAEIGTLAGYSGVCLARGLAASGKLFTFEFESKHAKVAAESFRLAGLSEKVEILVGSAIDNLPKIQAEGPFDLIFIDADKESYPSYYEWSVVNLRKGGMLVADNTLANGGITDPYSSSPRIKTLRGFNDRAAHDPRVRATLLPGSDGLTLAVRI